MRMYWLAAAGLVLGGSALLAQPPVPPVGGPAVNPAAAALDPANNRLDAHLLQWEQKMKAVDRFLAECVRTDTNKVSGFVNTYGGTAKYLKPNMAALDMVKKNNPQVFEKFLFTGTYLYEFSQQQKQVRVHELPPPRPGQMTDDNLLPFLSGMKAEEAKRRYDLKLVKEDQHYIYLEILPRFPADKAEFSKARLVLTQNTYLPRELWFEEVTGNEIKWDIPRIDTKAQVSRADFAPPYSLPAGWTLVKVPKQQSAVSNPPPRVVRPNQ